MLLFRYVCLICTRATWVQCRSIHRRILFRSGYNPCQINESVAIKDGSVPIYHVHRPSMSIHRGTPLLWRCAGIAQEGAADRSIGKRAGAADVRDQAVQPLPATAPGAQAPSRGQGSPHPLLTQRRPRRPAFRPDGPAAIQAGAEGVPPRLPGPQLAAGGDPAQVRRRAD